MHQFLKPVITMTQEYQLAITADYAWPDQKYNVANQGDSLWVGDIEFTTDLTPVSGSINGVDDSAGATTTPDGDQILIDGLGAMFQIPARAEPYTQIAALPLGADSLAGIGNDQYLIGKEGLNGPELILYDHGLGTLESVEGAKTDLGLFTAMEYEPGLNAVLLGYQNSDVIEAYALPQLVSGQQTITSIGSVDTGLGHGIEGLDYLASNQSLLLVDSNKNIHYGTLTPVPEPCGVALGLTGLAALVLGGRRSRRRRG